STYISALAFLASLHVVGLLLFTRGFLLTRQALPDINECSPIAPSGNLDPSCSLPPTHEKVIFLVVDALRADFVLPVDTASANSFYSNHITLPAELTRAEPTHSFLAHFIADAPTTTLQRIKGMTTGSLPTFVDAGSNFAGEQADEDNWLWQAKRAGKRIALVGDETWLNVYPRGAGGQRSVWEEGLVWPYDSFDVEDLDTVDNGVRQHLLELLVPTRQRDWDIVIAHGLGLDHAGHRFGAEHRETTRKLQETDRLLRDVVDRMSDDTLLMVVGDHGMTDRGDHGGDSREEVDAALWIYSKRPVAQGADHLGDRFDVVWSEKGLSKASRSVSQIDLVPTLSLLLGLPIPFGNLGVPIPEMFFRTTSLPTLLQATLLASSELSHYFMTYTSRPNGKDLLPSMAELSFVLELAKGAYKGAHAPGHVRGEMEMRALEKFWTFERKAREKARVVWARFDPVLMGAGLAVWLGSLAVAYRLYDTAKRGPRARFLVGHAVEGSLGALFCGGLFAMFGPARGRPSALGAAFVAAIGAEIGVICTPFIRRDQLRLPQLRSLRALVPVLPLAAHAALFGSNSMTVFEDSAVLYLLATLILCSLARAFAAPEARLRKRLIAYSLVALVAVRLMAVSTICREEQVPRCKPTFYLSPGSSTSLVVLGLSVAASLLVPIALRSSLAVSKSDEGLAPAFIGIGVRALLLSASTYWAVDLAISAASFSSTGAALANVVKIGVARIVLVGATLGGSLIWHFLPLCIRIQREQVKNAAGQPMRTQIKVIGFANALGSTYLLYFATVFVGVFLASPPPAQIVLTLHLIVLLCLLEIFDSERDVQHLETALTSTLSLEAFLNDSDERGLPPAPPHTGPTFVQVSTLALLAHLSFFATGHQAVISSIQWSTAFIGFPTVVYPFSPILVLLNSLGSFVLTAAALPLFVLWNLSPTLRDQGAPMTVGRNLLRAGAAYMAYFAALALASAACAAWLRRHLMVWKVFAPRFMLAGLALLATDL
ncbi:alkaline phosphatase-like protein, partial [Rhodotorula sp. JG-1b]